MSRRLVFALAALLLACSNEAGYPQGVLDVATTTSVRDSGLLDELLPSFSEETEVRVRLVVVGSGAALRMGADGDVDALVTHAPEGELALVRAGKLVDRRPFMWNHFVIAGPPEDPAGIRAAASAREAMAALAAGNAPYVSRADDSGTHRREQALLRAAGLEAGAVWPGVLRTHAGMGPTLQVAGERRAYVLSDVGTFRAFRARIELEAFSDPEDPDLRNVYSVLRPNPERAPPGRLDSTNAERFADFLVAPGTQRRIAAFRVQGAAGPLFRPLALETAAGDSAP